MSTKTHAGGCQCGAVRYEVDLDLTQLVNRCNCTMCTKTSAAVILVKPEAFRLTAGQDSITDYLRSGSPNHFPFCKHCGVHAYANGNMPEVGGAYVSINVLCLDDVDPTELAYRHWDGRHNNWAAGPRPDPWPVRQA